jgi:hypothetical protein
VWGVLAGARPARRWAALLLLTLVHLSMQSAALRAQDDSELVLHVYTLRHQTAADALGLVQPLLSPRGTVELRPGANTLVLRDTPAAISRILPVLVGFDHPSRPVDVELWMVRASGKISVSPPVPPRQSNVPADLLRALAEHLPYEQYGLLGSSKVRGAEGERMTFQVGGNYAVRFRLGTVVAEQRLRLNDFEVILQPDNGDPVPLLKSQLNLWLGRSMVFALSPGEGSSTALMVVVRCRAAQPPGAAAIRATPRPRGGGG